MAELTFFLDGKQVAQPDNINSLKIIGNYTGGSVQPQIAMDDLEWVRDAKQFIDNWVETMNYWYERLVNGGVLFLYLPDYSQKYWRPWNNRKHKHVFVPEMIRDYMVDRGYKNVFVSGVDLNNSFMIMGEK